ncbi:cytochrome P450 [Sphingobium estronivorans]|uniref:cytochrome P450 n=1 Tax=Sphingobium estronivorans TaxID=1577690 RepID=UPI001238C7AE|nr:cytochrome P450 [Sphingobium estronivorans]
MNDDTRLTVDYDPFSHEAMAEPADLYKAMRAEGCPHWIGKYNAWALTRFDDLRSASLKNAALDFTHGQTPGQLLLGEPVPTTFMTMNVPDNRKWRGLLDPFYTPAGVEAERPRLEALVRDEFAPLIGRDTVDIYHEFTSRVMCINSGYNLGLDHDEAVACRKLIDDILLYREPGQVGATSPVNQAAAQQLGGLLHGHIAKMRRDPMRAGPHGRVLMEAEVDGRRLDDGELLNYLFSLLVVGSETTPMAAAGTFYYLARHPDQKAAVLADPSLARAAFLETCRFDQPTNMLARRARADFELSGCPIKAGDNLLFIYASANRDESRFERADEYDIFRTGPQDISFGVGAHFCLGAYLATIMGELMVQQLIHHAADFELIEDGVERAYGEHLSGFMTMKLRMRWK